MGLPLGLLPYNKYLAWELREHPLSHLWEVIESWGDELVLLRGR